LAKAVIKVKKSPKKKATKAELLPRPMVWGGVALLFLAGLACRIAALDLRPAASPQGFPASRWEAVEALPFLENDEQIYTALVEQLDRGKGYTLQGHPILNEINHEQYDHPLFFHPPGGLVFFWLFHRMSPERGLALAQVVSYGVFYWSMIALAVLFFEPFNPIGIAVTAALAAFSPIMTHVAGRFWLDGPLLAFTTLAAAVFLYGMRRRSTTLACVAGFLLGFASLIKLTAFLVVPGLIAIAALALREQRVVRQSILFLAIAIAVQAPWEIWQWVALGNPLPVWAGRPSSELVRTNQYVHYLTSWREPWIYLELLPQVLWTVIPSIVLAVAQWRNREVRSKSVALFIWIGTVVGAHVFLGLIGYSKLLRYVILVTPATILLFSVVTATVGRQLGVPLLALAAIGLGLEITQGIVSPLHDNLDLIKPLPGLRTLDYGQPMPWPPS
jgi:4-amino-4-deoxy-L-arabinose transferase-like glycosyltransferase